MTELKEYTVHIAGLPHTVQLDDAEAERRGLSPVEAKAAPVPQNKARDARTKGGPRGDSAPAAERD